MLGCIVPISFALLLALSACAAHGADLNLDKWVRAHHHPQPVNPAVDQLAIGASRLPDEQKINSACNRLLKAMRLCH